MTWFEFLGEGRVILPHSSCLFSSLPCSPSLPPLGHESRSLFLSFCSISSTHSPSYPLTAPLSPRLPGKFSLRLCDLP